MNTEDEGELEIERDMASTAPSAPEEHARESGAPGGGAGRTDVPGHTGVYPVSASEGASGEAQVRGEPAWGQGERGAEGYEDSGDSSLEAFTAPRESEGTDDTRSSAP